jgi:flagellar biosynthetic protein FliQ
MDAEIINILSQSMWTAGAIAGPILAVSLVIGLVVGLLQSVIQVQEPTLTFVPKLIGVAGVLIIGGNWMMALMTDHVQELLARAPELIRL